MTVMLTVVLRVRPPPVPVMVTVVVAGVAVAETKKVSVELPEPGAANEEGLKEAVTPAGRPETERKIAELKPPEIVVEIVDAPELPWAMESEVGEAAMPKFGTGLVT